MTYAHLKFLPCKAVEKPLYVRPVYLMSTARTSCTVRIYCRSVPINQKGDYPVRIHIKTIFEGSLKKGLLFLNSDTL